MIENLKKNISSKRKERKSEYFKDNLVLRSDNKLYTTKLHHKSLIIEKKKEKKLNKKVRTTI